MIALLERAGGATLEEIVTATSWQKHSVRGFISTLASKHGYTIVSARRESDKARVSGRADVVEFQGAERVPFPVEYKHGKSKLADCDRVQLCAQALCLEEMTGKTVPRGALFYATPRRRENVEFTVELRATTEAAAARMHELWQEGRTPPPVKTPGCKSCSLLDLCQPDALESKNAASRYVRRLLADLDRET